MWYKTGTINLIANNATVTGTGTAWADAKFGVMPGMILLAPDNKLYEVKQVNSNTSLTLNSNYAGSTANGQSYAIITTYEGDISQFSARFAAMLTFFQGSRNDTVSWFTGSGDMTFTKDDGIKLTVPTLAKIQNDCVSTSKTTEQSIKGALSLGAYLKVSGMVGYLPTSQGAYMTWNRISGTGTTDFMNHKGNGPGGFNFNNVATDGTVNTLATLNNNGLLTLSSNSVVPNNSGYYAKNVAGYNKRLAGLDSADTVVLGTDHPLVIQSTGDPVARINGTDYVNLSTKNAYTSLNMDVLSGSPSTPVPIETWRKVGTMTNLGQGGVTVTIMFGGNNGYNGGVGNNGFAQVVLRSGNGTASGVNTAGRASITGYLMHGTLFSDVGAIETSSGVYDVYVKFRPYVANISGFVYGTSIPNMVKNWTWSSESVSEPELILGHNVISFWNSVNLPNPISVGNYGLGGTAPVTMADPNNVGQNMFFSFLKNTTNAPSTEPWAGITGGFDGASRWQLGWAMGGTKNNLQTRVRAPTGVWSTWANLWHSTNTTVDANGFLKSASPIARLSSNPEKMPDEYLDGFTLSGLAAVNGEAAGVTAERVSVGVYKVTGSLGFALEGWNIEVPQDVNGNRLCFVATEAAEDGTITVKVSKRRFDIDTAAIVAGEPMDIPEGRWIDLRLEMPPVEEVQSEPEPESHEGEMASE
ncbi:hypothetical protein ACKWMY_04950 [Serratia sp. J2]|uniref:phage tail fiber protein n=1 Tax=Serratia sp. J2 TaxID=3386551 RepID=UPI00391761C0